jgi:hypothetical protein
VPQPIPDDAVEKAPASIRDVKLLDPACGSGHFLVIAFDLLFAMYREEARHRSAAGGEGWSDTEIAESIVANNLHGIDIDPRAIQIAAAGLWLKAKLAAPGARLTRMNLVAPVLRLGHLPADDPALAALQSELAREVKLPRDLTSRLIEALAGVDYLGTLLRVDDAVVDALKRAGAEYEKNKGWQGGLFTGLQGEQLGLPVDAAKATVLDKLEQFLARHSGKSDLGIRLDGEQLAAGVRFVRLAKAGAYDVVVGNPPYQGISKTTRFEYVTKNYPRGKADLYGVLGAVAS